MDGAYLEGSQADGGILMGQVPCKEESQDKKAERSIVQWRRQHLIHSLCVKKEILYQGLLAEISFS